METQDRPRRLGGFLFALALVGMVAVVWAAVALAAGSGGGSSSGSGTTSSSSTQTPAASSFYGAQAAFAADGMNGGCPDHGGGATAPSTTTPSTPTPSTTTADGSTDPRL